MNSEPRVLPFRWILPAAQLLICAVALWPIRNLLVFRQPEDVGFQFDTGTPPSESPNTAGTPAIVLDDPVLIHFSKIVDLREEIPVALNLPVALVAVPYAIVNPAKTDWVPKGMDVRTWRAISWPFAGLIFWWNAGLSVEALLWVRRGRIQPTIGWISMTVGMLVIVIGIMFSLTPFFGADAPGFPWVLLGSAGVGWTLLGGLTVVFGIAQRRMRSRMDVVETRERSAS